MTCCATFSVWRKMMLPTTLGGLSPDEFDQLIDSFIEREDPYAISLDVLAELDDLLAKSHEKDWQSERGDKEGDEVGADGDQVQSQKDACKLKYLSAYPPKAQG